MKSFALAFIAALTSAADQCRTVVIDTSTLGGLGWAETVLPGHTLASTYSKGLNLDYEPVMRANLGIAHGAGVSELDRKLLTEGWKIGRSADDFLPAEMNVGSVLHGSMPSVGSEFDKKLLTEGWKIGRSADDFLPAEMNVGSVLHGTYGSAPSVGSEFDRKLLTEGWKIGRSADDFLPAEMNVGSVLHGNRRSELDTRFQNIGASTYGSMPIGGSEFDKKLLTEGWKIGRSADDFLPPEMNIGSVLHSNVNMYPGATQFLPEQQIYSQATREFTTPSGLKAYTTADLGEALKIQESIRNRLNQDNLFVQRMLGNI